MTTLTKTNGNRFPSFFDLSRDLLDWNNAHFSETATSLPAVNIKETDDMFEVEMAAPGMSKEDFQIELNNNLLTISSERRKEHEETDKDRYTRREFSYQSFRRTFTLSNEVVDAEKIKARYENGVLQLEIPKKEEARKRPPRRIAIK